MDDTGNRVVRVWGKADEYDIEMSLTGDRWTASVPLNLEEGKYACQLFAQSLAGRIGVWTGFLYMSGGVARFDLTPGTPPPELLSDPHEIVLLEG